MSVKKTEQPSLSEAEQRRYEDIVRIQNLLTEGYAPVQIKEMLHTTYFRIRRYATGDPIMLCRFRSDKDSEASRYRNEIIDLLTNNVTFKNALKQITALGYKGKRSAFEAYCRKLIAELSIPYKPRRNAAGVPIESNRKKPAYHYVSKSDLVKYLWSGKEIESSVIEFILGKYPCISEIRQCIQEFRNVYSEKSIPLLDQFIDKYSNSTIKPIGSFASGLRSDIDAVKNSVLSELSNGFVEGNNNKIKLIKRMMYGRAKIDLLRVKVLFSR